jgi:methanogenic corrinoid protein MtbC1
LLNVTETTVKRWADGGIIKCHKTPGGHRKFLMSDLIEFTRDRSYAPTGTVDLEPGDSRIQLAVLARDFPALSDVYIEKALTGGRHEVSRYLSFLYQHAIPVPEICDAVIAPGMKVIGDRWENGSLGIDHEHRASHATLSALIELQTELAPREHSDKTILCTSLAEDLHEIGLRCIAAWCESEGWNVHYLGGMTPCRSIINTMDEIKPAVVCLSITRSDIGGSAREDLKNIVAAAHIYGGRVFVGGRGVTPNGIDETQCDVICGSLADLSHALTKTRAQGRTSQTER